MCLPGQNKANTSELSNVHIHMMLQSRISGLFQDKNSDSITINWQQTFENTKKTNVLEIAKSRYELNIDNNKTKIANVFTLITY